jgi:GT2 family glycosyltransferase
MATRDKASYLDLTLASLELQCVPHSQWEVIVTDDASSDGTPEVLAGYRERGRLQLRWSRSPGGGNRAAARNAAVKAATGRVIIFLDDDRLARPDLLLYHLMHHSREPLVVIGNVSEAIHTHISPEIDAAMWKRAQLLSERLGTGGTARDDRLGPEVRRLLSPEDLDDPERMTACRQDEYDLLAAGIACCRRCGVAAPEGWIYFRTGNASVLREAVLDIGGFDEDYCGWGLEDNDLAIRLSEYGLPFVYEPRASAPHQLHARSPTQWQEHSENLKRLIQKHPQISADSVLQLQGRFDTRGWVIREAFTSWRQQGQVRPAPADPRSRLLWFVRGDRAGYARRSHALLTSLRSLLHGVAIRVVSYGPGEHWLWTQPAPVYELGNGLGGPADIAEAQGLWHLPPTDIAAIVAGSPERWRAAVSREIDRYRPDLIVSDEDPSVLPIARAAGISTVLVTEWPGEDSGLAERVIVADHVPSGGGIPEALTERVRFCGPLISAAPSRALPAEWRHAVGVFQGSLIVIFAEDVSAGHAGLVRLAAEAASGATKGAASVVIVARDLLPELTAGGGVPGALVIGALPEPLDLLVCADVVVDFGDRLLQCELAARRIPTVVLTTNSDTILSLPQRTVGGETTDLPGLRRYVPSEGATKLTVAEAIRSLVASVPYRPEVRQAAAAFEASRTCAVQVIADAFLGDVV